MNDDYSFLFLYLRREERESDSPLNKYIDWLVNCVKIKRLTLSAFT